MGNFPASSTVPPFLSTCRELVGTPLTANAAESYTYILLAKKDNI